MFIVTLKPTLNKKNERFSLYYHNNVPQHCPYKKDYPGHCKQNIQACSLNVLLTVSRIVGYSNVKHSSLVATLTCSENIIDILSPPQFSRQHCELSWLIYFLEADT